MIIEAFDNQIRIEFLFLFKFSLSDFKYSLCQKVLSYSMENEQSVGKFFFLLSINFALTGLYKINFIGLDALEEGLPI